MRQIPSDAAKPGWVRWCVAGDAPGEPSDEWLAPFRQRLFRFLAAVATCGLLVIGVRTWFFEGRIAWADLGNALYFATAFVLAGIRPGWLRPLAWLGLAALLANGVDGLAGHPDQAFTPAHVLFPLLVLYGTQLGDLRLSAAAAAGVLLFVGQAAVRFWPLGASDATLLANTALVAVVSGLSALGVWMQHRRLDRALRMEADSLRRELDARMRLNAIIFHDIRNPLAALIGAADMAGRGGGVRPAQMDVVLEMGRRIAAIIDSAREIGAEFAITRMPVAVSDLHSELAAVFGSRLDRKEQTFEVAEGAGVAVLTHPEILCHSVLGNLLANAAKFSPRGATIALRAVKEGAWVRLEIRDDGAGFPPAILERAARGEPYRSSPGTESERGSGFGLRIVALCLRRLGGWLELRNHPEGGAAVAAVLPAA